MAISFVAAGTVATGATSASPTFGASTTAGNLLVCIAAAQAISGAMTITGSGWLAVHADGTVPDSMVFYKPNCGAGETAPVVNGGSGAGFVAAVLMEFSGAAAASPLDQVRDNNSSVTPLSLTMLGADAGAGELVVAAQGDVLSKAGTATTSHTYNNGATAQQNLNNDGTSTATHYRFSYGITTGNASADNVSLADASMNLSQISGTIASFKVESAAPPEVIPDLVMAPLR